MVGRERPPNSMSETLARRTNEEAARWVVRLDAGALSEEEQREFDAWLEAAPHHRGALIRARAAWVDLDRIGALAGGSTTTEPTAVTDRRRWLLAAGIAGLAILGTSWLALHIDRDVYESGIGEIRRVTLADGSSMLLNTASKAVVLFDDATREIRLERGEALFHVRKDAARPFIVRTVNLTIRAVGTAFAVRVDEAQVDVTVTEGVVEIARARERGRETRPVEEPKRLVANQRAVVKTAEPVAIELVEPSIAQRRLAWRDGMVAFDGEPLGEAVAEVNRHSRRQIIIDDAALAARPVVGIFRASDVEAFSEAAATALGVRAVDEGDVIRLVPAEPPSEFR